MRSLPLIALVLSCCAVSQTPDPTPVDGRISGRVVNKDGKPVSGARVYLSEEASSLVDASSVVTRTDAAGRFDFGRKLKHGVYEIHAQKEKDGYPNPTSKFYQPLNFSPQNVQLFGDHPDEKITIQLEDQAAMLIGRVFDAQWAASQSRNLFLKSPDERWPRHIRQW
ncbi:MAG TPA: carboxypeptidase-like regulatory domain-containing protein [Candidatus Binatia bacterium]|nr:carboxypeptidase-like regulatory domain-containing protein [Candidatus Binatia bacterium]